MESFKENDFQKSHNEPNAADDLFENIVVTSGSSSFDQLSESAIIKANEDDLGNSGDLSEGSRYSLDSGPADGDQLYSCVEASTPIRLKVVKGGDSTILSPFPSDWQVRRVIDMSSRSSPRDKSSTEILGVNNSILANVESALARLEQEVTLFGNVEISRRSSSNLSFVQEGDDSLYVNPQQNMQSRCTQIEEGDLPIKEVSKPVDTLCQDQIVPKSAVSLKVKCCSIQ